MKWKLQIKQCEMVRGPSGAAGSKVTSSGIADKEISATDVDDARAKVDQIIKDSGKSPRSVSFGPDGVIRAMVWKHGKPNTPRDKNWIWKRPQASS